MFDEYLTPNVGMLIVALLFVLLFYWTPSEKYKDYYVVGSLVLVLVVLYNCSSLKKPGGTSTNVSDIRGGIYGGF